MTLLSVRAIVVLPEGGEAMSRTYTPARAEANARYDAKTYKKVNLALRVEEDKEIIQDLERAKQNGYTSREWLEELFEGNK